MPDQMMDSALNAQANGFILSPSQIKYLQEYEKYKHIVLEEGAIYSIKNAFHLHYIVISIQEEEVVIARLDKDNNPSFEQTKTAHWCRKKLYKESF